MTVAKEQRCAVCVKRHEVAAQVINEALELRTAPRLECRALPPVQDVAHHAVFPTVAPDHFCHVYYEEDGAAVIAHRQAAKVSATLDAKVAETQAAAAQAQAQPELALGDAPAPPRARRARSKAAE